ncbi:MAG: Wzz/FepE/Etk N-terminal domain-containing protein, partial [Candidatus Methylomirabilales bacterium]
MVNWRVIRKHAGLLVMVGGVSVLGALVVSLRMPKVYEATAAILAPKESQVSPERLTLLLAAPGASQLLGGMPPLMARNRDVFVSILKSRTMAQDVVERFQLKDRYRVRYLEDAINRLKSATKISVSKEGAISVKVEAQDPQLAADMANFYVSHLDRLLARFSTGEASRDRAFLEEQLAKAERSLKEAEEALKKFQEKNRAVVLPEQSKAAVEAQARLKGEIMASEVQLEVLRSFATEANPEVIHLKRKIGEMKRQLSRMQYGIGWELPPEGHNPG